MSLLHPLAGSTQPGRSPYSGPRCPSCSRCRGTLVVGRVLHCTDCHTTHSSRRGSPALDGPLAVFTAALVVMVPLVAHPILVVAMLAVWLAVVAYLYATTTSTVARISEDMTRHLERLERIRNEPDATTRRAVRAWDRSLRRAVFAASNGDRQPLDLLIQRLDDAWNTSDLARRAPR